MHEGVNYEANELSVGVRKINSILPYGKSCFAFLIFFFCFVATCHAKCTCVVEFNNGFDGEDDGTQVTITKIKTATVTKILGIESNLPYKTQWSGSRSVRDAGASKFTFTVDSSCRNRRKYKFQRKDKKECTLPADTCGTNRSPRYLLCEKYQWR